MVTTVKTASSLKIYKSKQIKFKLLNWVFHAASSPQRGQLSFPTWFLTETKSVSVGSSSSHPPFPHFWLWTFAHRFPVWKSPYTSANEKQTLPSSMAQIKALLASRKCLWPTFPGESFQSPQYLSSTLTCSPYRLPPKLFHTVAWCSPNQIIIQEPNRVLGIQQTYNECL